MPDWFDSVPSFARTVRIFPRPQCRNGKRSAIVHELSPRFSPCPFTPVIAPRFRQPWLHRCGRRRQGRTQPSTGTLLLRTVHPVLRRPTASPTRRYLDRRVRSCTGSHGIVDATLERCRERCSASGPSNCDERWLGASAAVRSITPEGMGPVSLPAPGHRHQCPMSANALELVADLELHLASVERGSQAPKGSRSRVRLDPAERGVVESIEEIHAQAQPIRLGNRDPLR